MTNLEKLRELVIPYPIVRMELNKVTVFHPNAQDEFGSYSPTCELVDIVDWCASPQGDSYWCNICYDGFPETPDGCWVDAIGVLHRE